MGNIARMGGTTRKGKRYWNSSPATYRCHHYTGAEKVTAEEVLHRIVDVLKHEMCETKALSQIRSIICDYKEFDNFIDGVEGYERKVNDA